MDQNIFFLLKSKTNKNDLQKVLNLEIEMPFGKI